MQALKSHMSVYIWLCTFLPPGKQMKEDKKRRGSCQSCLLVSQFSPISHCCYVYLCFGVRPSCSLAVWLNDGAALSDIDHGRRSRPLSADAGVYGGSDLRRAMAKPYPSITLSTCWTMEGRRIRRADERREGERESIPQQVYYYYYYLSLH